MPKISIKCQECSKIKFRRPSKAVKPDCFITSICNKKRSYYRKIDHYRKLQRKRHKYIKYCKNKCALCGSKDKLEVHHINPQALKIDHSRFNVLTLCQSCHSIITRYYTAIGIGRKKYKDIVKKIEYYI